MKLKILNSITIFLSIFIVVFYLNKPNVKIELAFKIKTNKANCSEIYYDTGKGFNEKEHKTFCYDKGENNIILKIKVDKINNLRLDPLTDSGEVIFSDFYINKHLYRFDKLSLTPLHNISQIKVINPYKLYIKTNGKDPYLIFMKKEIMSKKYDSKYFINIIKNSLYIFILFLVIIKISEKLFKTFTKENILIFSLYFYIFINVVYFFSIEWNDIGKSLLLYLSFSKYIFIEYLLFIILVYLFFQGKIKFLKRFVYVISFLYILLNTVQLLSFLVSGEFISLLAINNVEHIDLLVTSDNIIYVVLILSFTILSYFLAKKYTNIFYKYFIKMIILLIVSYIISYKIYYKQQQKLQQINNIIKFSPIDNIIKLFIHKHLNTKFSKEDLVFLKKHNINIKIKSIYPIRKNFIYKNEKFKNKNYNIIVIFTEGLSARTTSVYSTKFQGLTPNLEDFAKYSTKFVNYYNHTAATYRGLLGQNCSIYTNFGGATSWEDKTALKINYKCLPKILRNQNYYTEFLNPHIKSVKIYDMLKHIGFEKVWYAEEILKEYLPKETRKRPKAIDDQQLYRSLIKHLKTYDKKTPFLLELYSEQTHAWVNTSPDGIKYNSGKYETLNTIHNMDNAFGKFWNYFKKSKYFNNTIIVFTADHAHYYDKKYLKLVNDFHLKSYKKVFVDKVPLLIYIPNTHLSKSIDVKDSTSIDLAPTICQILDVKNEKNHFLGQSLFEISNKNNIGISAIGREEIFLIKNEKIYDYRFLNNSFKRQLKTIHKYIDFVRSLEKQNRLIEKNMYK